MNDQQQLQSNSQFNEFQDLHKDQKIKYDGSEIQQQKLQHLNKLYLEYDDQKDYFKQLNILKKMLFIQQNDLKLYIKIAKLFYEIGDINNSIKYYLNIQAIQMMDYYKTQENIKMQELVQQKSYKQSEKKQTDQKIGKLSETESQDYLNQLQTNYKIQGILNLNYGMFKGNLQELEKKKDIKMGQELKFTMKQINQEDIMDFKVTYQEKKMTNILYQMIRNGNVDEESKEYGIIIQIMGLLSQNERQQSLRVIESFQSQQSESRQLEIKKLNEENMLILYLKALILHSLDRLKESSHIFWAIYIDKGYHYVQQDQVFLQILDFLLNKSESEYKECQELLLKGEHSKCQIYIQSSLDYCFWNPSTLIIKSYIDRKNQKYDKSLHSLESGYKTLKLIQEFKQNRLNINNSVINKFELKIDELINNQQESKLRAQISLCYNEMGQYFYSKSKFSEAYSIFNEALEFQQNDFGIYVNRGDCLRENNLLEDALKDYLKALELFNNKYQLTNNNNKDQDKIKDDFNTYSQPIDDNQFKIKNQRLQIHQRISMLFHRLGIEYFNQNNYQSSKEVLDKAIEFDDQNYQLFLNRGKCCQNLNDIQGCIKNYKQSLALNPNQTNLKILLKNMNDPKNYQKSNQNY